MVNPYQAPMAAVADVDRYEENNSGGGKDIALPEGIKGWSWGAFFLNWIWAVSNKVWIGLLCLVPYVGVIIAFYLGFKGRELAWRKKRWNSIEDFNRVQKRWSFWGVTLVGGLALLGIVVAVLAPR